MRAALLALAALLAIQTVHLAGRIADLERRLRDAETEARFAADLAKLNVADVERIRRDLGPDFLPYAEVGE